MILTHHIRSRLFFRGLANQVGLNMPRTSINELLTRTVPRDNPTPTEARIEGNLPEWVSGELLRTGPAIYQVGKNKMKHFFDGYAMLLRFTIKNGSVQYQSHFLRSEVYQESFKQNRIVSSEFGTLAYPDPCQSIFHRFMTKFMVPEMTDNGNVNIVPIGDELYASSETHNLCKIDLTSMTNTEKVNILGRNNIAVNTQTAHPHIEPDGTVYNLGTAFLGKCCYKIVRFDPPKEGSGNTASVLGTIPSSSGINPSYYHSFGMTQNYIIFMEYPLILNTISLVLSRFSGKSFSETLSFDESKSTFIHILDKKSGKRVVKLKTDAMFCFHHINAYEKDNHVVMDLIHYKNTEILDRLYLDRLRNDEALDDVDTRPRRFVLPLRVEEGTQPNTELTLPAGTSCRAVLQTDGIVHCYSEELADVALELPRINYEHYNGKPYRYLYGVGTSFGQLIKLDVEEKSFVVWKEEGCFPAEPIFVARPGATEEDDGVILSTVLESSDEKNPYLLVLDGKTLKEICRAVVPAERWAISLHGLFLSKV